MIIKAIMKFVVSIFALIAILFIILLTPAGLHLTLVVTKALLPGKMEYRHASGLITGPIHIDGFKYTNQSGSISIERIKISWNPLQLLKKKIVIKKLIADTVHLDLKNSVITKKENKISQKRLGIKKKSFPFLLDLQDAHLSHLSIVTHNQPREILLSSINLNLKNTSTGQWIVRSKATLEKPIPVQINMTMTGNLEHYLFKIQLKDKKIFSWQLNGWGNISQAHFQLHNGKTLEGTLSFNLNLQWQPFLQWQLSLQGDNLKITQFLPNSPEQIDLSLISQGKIQSGRPLFNAKIRLTSRHNTLSLTASQDHNLKLNWNAKINQLSDSWKQFKGTVISQGSWNSQSRHSEGTITVEKFSLLGYQGKKLTGQWNLNQQIQKISQFVLSGEDFKTHGIHLESFFVSGKGIKTNHQLTGKVQIKNQIISLQLIGGLFDKEWKGQLKTLGITTSNNLIWQSTRPSKLTVSPTAIKLSTLCLSNPHAPGTICMEGGWHAKEIWSLQINGNHIDLEPLLSHLIPELSMTSFANVAAKIVGKSNKIQDVQGNLQINKGSLKYNLNNAFIETPLQTGTVRFELKGNDLNTQSKLIFTKNNLLSVSLSFPNFTISDPKLPQTISGKIDLNLMDLSLFDKFFTGVLKPKGKFSANLSVGGPLLQPSMTGSINLLNGNIFLPRLDIYLEQIKAEISSVGRKINYKMTASSKEENIQLEGNAIWMENLLKTSTTIKGKDFLIMNTPEYTLYVSPNIEINTEGSHIDFTGRIKISKGIIQPYILSNVKILPADEIIYLGGTHPAIPALIWKTSMDLQLSIGKEVLLKTKGINAKTKGTVNLKQKVGGTIITNGRIQVLEGEYNAYGKSLEISKGSSIQYINSPITNPNLNIRATKVITVTSSSQSQQLGVNNLIVGINVTGSIQHPQIDFFSIPSSATLSQADILSYLILGYSTQNSSTSSLSLILEAANSLSTDGKATGISGVISEIKQGLGLSELGIESETIVDVIGTPIDQQSSFVIGKRLTKRIYIRYSYGLGQGPLTPANIFQLRYSLGKNWILQTDSSNLGNGGDIFYTIETD